MAPRTVVAWLAAGLAAWAAGEAAAKPPQPAPFALAAPQDPRAAFEKRRNEMMLAQSQRHLEYGLELRKQGLPTQAAAQIVLAAELGGGRNPAALQVLSIMRQYDEAFWKRHGSRPTARKLESYDKQARALTAKDGEELLKLAEWGTQHQCGAQADAIYMELLLARDEPLEFDAKGRIVLPHGTIPEAASAKIADDAVQINGRRYVRDALLSKLPEVLTLFEVSDEEVRVRSTTSLEEARDLHALCKALLPKLEQDLGAKPERRLPLFVFGKRPDYERTLDQLGLSGHKTVAGVASSQPFVAIVCAEGLARPAVEEVPEDAERGPDYDILRGVCLHELTHLFSAAVSRSAFPCWYEEGLADTFGGSGTFVWDGKSLQVGGLLARSRLDALRDPKGRMPLNTFLIHDALSSWRSGTDAGLAFYAQAWAWVRYLRSGAGTEVATRFEAWEDRCRGQMLGFEPGRAGGGDRASASNLFYEMFGKDLPKLEAGFAVWLEQL